MSTTIDRLLNAVAAQDQLLAEREEKVEDQERLITSQDNLLELQKERLAIQEDIITKQENLLEEESSV